MEQEGRVAPTFLWRLLYTARYSLPITPTEYCPRCDEHPYAGPYTLLEIIWFVPS